MKKTILSMAVAALAVTLNAGETNQNASAAPACDKPKTECPASTACCAQEKAKDCCPKNADQTADAAKPADKAGK